MDQTNASVAGDGAAPGASESRDFAAVLRTAIERRGLTLTRAQARLGPDGVSVATLSNWQSGRSLPGRRVSRGVLHNLESILDLAPGTLDEALERTLAQRREDAARELGPGPLHPKSARIHALFESLGLSFQDGFSRLSVLERVELGASGAPLRISCNLTLRAERDGLDGFTSFQAVNVSGPERGIGELRAGLGCTLRKAAVDDDGQVGVAEFALPRTLGRGELVAVRLVETFPDLEGVEVDPDSYCAYGRVHRTAFRDAGLEVVFHPDLVPVSVEQFYEPADTGRLSDPDALFEADTYGRRPLMGRIAQSHISGRGPGMTGMRWNWD